MKNYTYKLNDGEKAVLIIRRGRSRGQFHRGHLASIAIERRDGSKVYKPVGYCGGYSPYWVANTSTYGYHYKSGLNKCDHECFTQEYNSLQILCDEINEAGIVK